jgi:hypothetical protein
MVAIMSKFSILALVIGFSIKSVVSVEQFITITPCHAAFLRLHNIPRDADCSTIKWDLTLTQENGNQTFLIKSEWGYYIDNRTLEKRGSSEVKGIWIVEESGTFPRLILKTQNGITLSFRKLDSNHLHALDATGNLLNGNGGWSFTLNKVGGVIPAAKAVTRTSATSYKETFASRAFHGRTPCQEIAREAKITVDHECFKLKWIITLYQDSAAQSPSHYEMNRTQHRKSLIKGKWKIYTTKINNKDEVIYELDPDNPEVSMRFMKGDDNVLFFLDNNFNLLPGSDEFSYTLNRR